MLLAVAARCSNSGQLAAGVVSDIAGAAWRTPQVRAGVGAAIVSPSADAGARFQILGLLSNGMSARTAGGLLTEEHDELNATDIAMVDAMGQTFAFSFETNGSSDSTSGLSAIYSDARRTAAERDEVSSMVRRLWQETEGDPLVERILASLRCAPAGAARCAAIQVAGAVPVAWGPGVVEDVRVDDSDEPLAELQRLHRITESPPA